MPMRKMFAQYVLIAALVASNLASTGLSAQASRSPVAPRRELVEAIVKEAYEKFKTDTNGKNADYIPYLAQVDSKLFGIAVVTTDNQVFTLGDVNYSFSIQSISKVYTLALAMEELGPDKVFEKVGSEPTGRPFNSPSAVVDMPTHTGNPLVNAGAIATTSLISGRDAEDKWNKILNFYSKAAGEKLVLIDEVYKSEAGFNPTDMYAADHIRRVLLTFPGVFSGIGEFSIHKEFVSAKIAGPVASLQDPALDRILDFAAEAGLVVLIHNDIDTPFAKEGTAPAYAAQVRSLFKRHPKTTIIWAHIGVGRVVRPAKEQGAIIEEMLKDPELSHVSFDISWNEVAKYVVATPASTQAVADIINRYPDRFLFGTDEVAPSDQEQYVRVYQQYGPLWKLLSKDASEKVRKANYERIFNEARSRVRAWESAHGK